MAKAKSELHVREIVNFSESSSQGSKSQYEAHFDDRRLGNQ